MATYCTVEELKASLKASQQSGFVLDIDETLAATNVAWFDRCARLFGNPDGLSVLALIDKYHLAQHNPAWQTNEAQSWMQEQRQEPEAQDNLPLIPGALEGVQELWNWNPSLFVGYLTVRPEKVTANTIQWLQENGFPDLPVVAKPNEIPFEQGNQWKAQALHDLFPYVTGIVDDNPKVPTFAGAEYNGQILLFGRDKVEEAYHWAIPCKTWPVVVKTMKNMLQPN